MQKYTGCLVTFGLLLLVSPILAHKGKPHEKAPKDLSKNIKTSPPIIVDKDCASKFKKINFAYKSKVEPIFKAKCANCHSSKTKYPWYYRLPIAKGMIDTDVKEGKEHINIDEGFPFLGHGSIKEDLEAIRKVSHEDTMPPLRYILLNWHSRLSQQEKKIIVDWTEQSEKLLNLPNEAQCLKPHNVAP